jgi:hypothetical protein
VGVVGWKKYPDRSDSFQGPLSETPSTLVVALISFFCPCGRAEDHAGSRNLD